MKCRALAAGLIVLAVLGAVGPSVRRAEAFLDVAPGAFYSKAVDWLEYERITTGVGGGVMFDPDGVVTRGQMATFLWRLAGEPSAAGGPLFPDVSSGAFYATPVRWLAREGITTGVGNTGLFQPDAVVTRGQMATFLWRLAGEPSAAGGPLFPDVSSGAFFATPVRWLAREGITTGVGNTGLFQPDAVVTRGQMATFLWRFAGTPSPPPGWQPPTPRPPASIVRFGDGVHRVGIDIPAGTYRTVGWTASCYWARTSGFSGSLADIIANDIGSGPRLVTVEGGDLGFESQRCGEWTNFLAAVTHSLTAPFGDGVYIVGTDIAPGTWRAEGTSGCYWARTRGFSGELGDIIDNDIGDGTRLVAIQAGDRGFESARCGTWHRVG